MTKYFKELPEINEDIPRINELLSSFFETVDEKFSITYHVIESDEYSLVAKGLVKFENIQIPFKYVNIKNQEDLKFSFNINNYDIDTLEQIVISTESGQVFKTTAVDYLMTVVNYLPNKYSKEISYILKHYCGLPNSMQLSTLNYEMSILFDLSNILMIHYHENKRLELACSKSNEFIYFSYDFPVKSSYSLNVKTSDNYNYANCLPQHLSKIFNARYSDVETCYNFESMNGINDFINNFNSIENLIEIGKI